MKFGSLFSGIGGLDLGLERSGMQCAWQVEINEYATKVLAKHWPDVRRYRDVREVGAHNLEPVDLVCGGFPCQDISLEGFGAGIDGERSGLWREFYRIICELRPRYVLVENVAALLIRGMDRVLGDLARSGYDAEWRVLSPTFFGLPHLRRRVFLIAYPNAQRLEGRVFERQRLRAKAFSEEEVWSLLPGPYIRRAPYGVSERVGRIGGSGNAVVPQVAQWVGQRILEYDKSLQACAVIEGSGGVV